MVFVGTVMYFYNLGWLWQGCLIIESVLKNDRTGVPEGRNWFIEESKSEIRRYNHCVGFYGPFNSDIPFVCLHKNSQTAATE